MSSADAKNHKLTLAFLLAVSIFGLVLSTFFVVHPFAVEDDFAFRKLTVGSAFSAVCIMGIFAALFPSSCSAISKFRKRNGNDSGTHTIHETNLRAHHPSCDNYSTHILSIGNMKFCATCLGLLVGAILVLFGTSLYFFAGLGMGDPTILVLLGVAGVSLGLLQSVLPKFSGGLTRFFASILFVTGTFLMLVGIDAAAKNTSIGLFFVTLCVLWILTKITLSQKDHQRICANCSVKSCSWNKKRRR